MLAARNTGRLRSPGVALHYLHLLPFSPAYTYSQIPPLASAIIRTIVTDIEDQRQTCPLPTLPIPLPRALRSRRPNSRRHSKTYTILLRAFYIR